MSRTTRSHKVTDQREGTIPRLQMRREDEAKVAAMVAFVQSCVVRESARNYRRVD